LVKAANSDVPRGTSSWLACLYRPALNIQSTARSQGNKRIHIQKLAHDLSILFCFLPKGKMDTSEIKLKIDFVFNQNAGK